MDDQHLLKKNRNSVSNMDSSLLMSSLSENSFIFVDELNIYKI